MIEALMGGAILAAALSLSLALLANARAEATLSAKHSIAVSLARAKLDELVSSLPIAVADQAAVVAVGADFPGMHWRWTTTASSVGASAAAGFTNNTVARQIEVGVEFPCVRGSREDQRAGAPNDGRGEIVMVRLWMR